MSQLALIIEDHPIYRDAMLGFTQTLVGKSEAYAVSSVEEALSGLVKQLPFNIILLDLGLPGLKGVEAISLIKKNWPLSNIVVISASENRREIGAALHAGARVAISKAVSTTTMAQVIRQILQNNHLDTDWITTTGNHSIANDTVLNLTQRQKEIISLLDLGLSNKEICLRLGLSEPTVKMHMSAIFRVLNVSNRTQAILMVRQLGLNQAN